MDFDTNTTWRKTLYVCSDHFEPTDFITSGPRKLLRALAIPSLNRSAPSEITSAYSSPSTSRVQALPLQMRNITESETSQNEGLGKEIPYENNKTLTEIHF